MDCDFWYDAIVLLFLVCLADLDILCIAGTRPWDKVGARSPRPLDSKKVGGGGSLLRWRS